MTRWRDSFEEAKDSKDRDLIHKLGACPLVFRYRRESCRSTTRHARVLFVLVNRAEDRERVYESPLLLNNAVTHPTPLPPLPPSPACSSCLHTHLSSKQWRTPRPPAAQVGILSKNDEKRIMLLNYVDEKLNIWEKSKLQEFNRRKHELVPHNVSRRPARTRHSLA